MNRPLTDLQLDALRELANVASGNAATALSQMLGREVEIDVPRALALEPSAAVESCGDPEEDIVGVVIPVEGAVDALVLLLVPPKDAANLCALLGVEADSEVGESALREIGNILGTSYLNALAMMTGLELMPCPPHLKRDMLAAIVATLLVQTTGASDLALVLDSELDVADEPCAISFLLLPATGGINDLLAPLGLA